MTGPVDRIHLRARAWTAALGFPAAANSPPKCRVSTSVLDLSVYTHFGCFVRGSGGICYEIEKKEVMSDLSIGIFWESRSQQVHFEYPAALLNVQ